MCSFRMSPSSPGGRCYDGGDAWVEGNACQGGKVGTRIDRVSWSYSPNVTRGLRRQSGSFESFSWAALFLVVWRKKPPPSGEAVSNRYLLRTSLYLPPGPRNIYSTP